MTRPAPPGPPLAVVYRALGLGDLLTAVPALRALRRGLPEHELVLATRGCFAELVLSAGLADRVVDTAPWSSLPTTLSAAELAVNLHGRGPESHRVLLAARPHRLVAFACDGVLDGHVPQWRPGEHDVVRWCRLVSSFGFPADPADLDISPTARAVAEVAAGATVVHPGASARARQWPVERWAAVARSEMVAGRRIVITGTSHERKDAEAVAECAGLPSTSVLAGMTSVADLVAVVAAADRVVCGDTGVAHVATAVRTPSVVLFGPTSPYEWGPPDRPEHRVLWAGRTGDPHGSRPHPGLLAISVDQVVEALAVLPNAGPVRAL